MWYSPIQRAGEVLLVLMVGLVLICVHSRGCVAPHPHQEVNTGVPSYRVKVAAAEVKFGLQSISEGAGGRGSRVNTGSMVYYNHRCKQCSCITAINKSWRGSGLRMRLAREYGSNTAFNLTVCTSKTTQVCLYIFIPSFLIHLKHQFINILRVCACVCLCAMEMACSKWD